MATSGTMEVWTTAGDGIRALRQVRVDVPAPGPTEVLVEVTALSLNYRDLLVAGGEGAWRPPAPVVPLSDAVGRVVAVGGAVDRFAPGDRVLPAFLPRWRTGELSEEACTAPTGGPVNRGMLADLVVIDQEEAARAPRTLDDVHAATLPVAGVTAWHALRRTGVARGETVLVHGTGGVALMAAQLAAALGARVVVTSGSGEKRRRAEELGAAATIDRRTQDVATEVRRLTGGRGADVVVETVGGSNLDVSLDAVRIGGRIAFVGLLAGLTGEISTYRFVTRNVTLHGIETGSRSMLEDLVTFIDAHGIVPVVDSVHPRARVREALGHLAAGDHFGKVVVAP